MVILHLKLVFSFETHHIFYKYKPILPPNIYILTYILANNEELWVFFTHLSTSVRADLYPPGR